MTTSEADPATIDGRTARGVRTRDALIDATMELVDEGDLRPTAPRIAERAGVSVRTVFQHFDDLETLFREFGDRAFERVAALAFRIDPDAPLAYRVERFVQQRCEINEALNPINRAASLQAPTSPAIRAQIKRGHDLATEFLQQVFATELAALGSHADGLFDGLRFATAWSTWNMCRHIEGRDVDASTEAVRRVVETVLAGCGFDPADSSG